VDFENIVFDYIRNIVYEPNTNNLIHRGNPFFGNNVSFHD